MCQVGSTVTILHPWSCFRTFGMGWDVAGWQSTVQCAQDPRFYVPELQGGRGRGGRHFGFCLKKRHVYFFRQPLSSCISRLNCFYKKYILEELLPGLPYCWGGGGPFWAMNIRVTNKHLSVGVKHFANQ